MVGPPAVLGVIQARGGSKGMPRKNLLPLGDFPLIAYSIASGLAATSITRLIVSTDSEEIAERARHYGAEVPFLRPASLATDEATDFPLFEHALGWLSDNERYHPDAVVQIRPTTPLRPKGLLDAAVALLLADPSADCVRGVTEPSQNPFKMWRRDDQQTGALMPLMTCGIPEAYNAPRQSLPATYWQTGHVDAIRTRTIVRLRSLTGRRLLPVLVDSRYCIDIDTYSDLDFAAWRLQRGDLTIDVPTALHSQ